MIWLSGTFSGQYHIATSWMLHDHHGLATYYKLLRLLCLAGHTIKTLYPILTLYIHKVQASYCTMLCTISFQTCNPCYIYLLQLSHTELAINGTAFSSSDQTGGINTTTLGANETAAAFLPPSLFILISNRTEVGTFFAVYNSGVLFPVTNETRMLPETNSTVTTVIGSPVLAATVGRRLNFSGLAEPVRILLQLNQELEVSSRNGCRKQLYASAQSYTLHRISQIQDVCPGILILKVCTQQCNFSYYCTITILLLL